MNLDTTEKSLTTYAPELLLGSNTSSDDQSTPDCRSNHPQNPESNPVGYDHGCNINQPTNNQPTITDPNSCKSTFSLDSNPDVHDESTVANKDDQNETTSSGSPDCSKDVNPANNQCRSDSDSDPRQHDSVSLASVCSGSEHKSCEVLKPIMVDILSDSTLIESHTAASASQYAYIPVTYHFKRPPPPESIIRATIVYAEPSHAISQLHRCQMHAKADTEVQPGSETHCSALSTSSSSVH